MEAPRRRKRALADVPACDKSKAAWPPHAEELCNAQLGVNLVYGMEYSMSDFMRMCQSASCMAVTGAMRASNPSECVSGYKLTLYAGFLNQLDETCVALQAGDNNGGDDPETPSPSPDKTVKPTPDNNEKKTSTPTKRRQNSTIVILELSSSGSSGASPSSSEGSSERDPSKILATSRGSSAGSSSDDTTSLFEGHSSSSSTQTNSPRSSKGKTNAQETIDTAQNTSSESSSSSGVTIGAVVGVIVIVVLAVLFLIRRRRQRAAAQPDKTASTPAIETGRYRTEEATYATLDSSEHDTRDSASDEFFDSAPSRLARADLAPLLEPLVPWQIDSSELTDVSLIGSGAQGAVYLVQLNSTRLLVSKRLVPDQLTERKLKSLVAEIQLVATLQHPSIVSFVGVAWSSPFNLQALFEYMPNGDLRSYLDQSKPEAQTSTWDTQMLEIALAIAEGLAYVHSFNPPIVHRDLKARNILLDSSFAAKISDFGVSRLQSEDGTMTTGIGTSRWLAPEVIAGGGMYTEQCDIYSFGVVLVEMDTHAIPFVGMDGTSEIMLLRQVSRGEIRPTVSPSCDPRIASLVSWCVQHNPLERPNALELSFELRQILKLDR